MKRVSLVLALVFSLLPLISANAIGNDVYIYKLEGSQLYLASQDQSDTAKQKLRIMEFVPEKSVLEIGNDTVAYITCPDCEIIKLTEANSPFTINMDDFKKKKSKSKIIISHFSAALKEFIYPDSKAGKRVYMHVRGTETSGIQDICDTFYPQDYEDIMVLGDHISFKWGIKGDNYNFQLRNSSNDQLIIDVEIKDTFVDIPFDKLKPGFVYNWKVVEKASNTTCQASFSILSEQDTHELKNNLNEITLLLPKNANQETKIRLQSSYLLSEGLIFNAFSLLEANGF